MDTDESTAVITGHCARCSGPVVSDPDADLCRACWAAANVAPGERVSVDAAAFATVRDMFSGGWCVRRNGEPCGESDCGQCDFDRWVDELIATAAPQPSPAAADARGVVVDAAALVDSFERAVRATHDLTDADESDTHWRRQRDRATARNALMEALTAPVNDTDCPACKTWTDAAIAGMLPGGIASASCAKCGRVIPMTAAPLPPAPAVPVGVDRAAAHDPAKMDALRSALVALTERLGEWSDEVLGTAAEFAAGEKVEEAREAVILAAGAVAVPFADAPADAQAVEA